MRGEQVLYTADVQDGHWTEVVSSSAAAVEATTTAEHVGPVSGSERRRREAVWELFTSQSVFFFDHPVMLLSHMDILRDQQQEEDHRGSGLIKTVMMV